MGLHSPQLLFFQGGNRTSVFLILPPTTCFWGQVLGGLVWSRVGLSSSTQAPLMEERLCLRHSRLRTLGSDSTTPALLENNLRGHTEQGRDRPHWTSPADTFNKKTNKQKLMGVGKSASRVGSHLLSKTSTFYQKLWNIKSLNDTQEKIKDCAFVVASMTEETVIKEF